MKLIAILLLLALPVYSQSYGGVQNALKIRGRAVSGAAPADTNTLCWVAATSTWAPCPGGPGMVTAPGAGAVARAVISKLADTVSVKDFGALGDGVTNDTAAIQAAITSLTAGGEVFIPRGTYVVTPGGLTTPNNGYVYTVRGASRSGTILIAASNAASATSMITAIGSITTRTYLQVKSLSINCASRTNTNGLYFNWGNPDSGTQDVKVYSCVSGIVVGNTYNMTIEDTTSTLNTVDGLRVGKLLDDATPGASNEFSIVSSTFNSNGRYGIQFTGARALSIVGSDIEGNTTGNFLCSLCKGVTVTATYTENNNLVMTEAQLHFVTCSGVTITGLDVSNTSTTPIIKAEGSDVTIIGMAVELTVLRTGTAVQVIDSRIVMLGGLIDHISVGFDIGGTSYVKLIGVTFTNDTVPVASSNAATVQLAWDSLTDALWAASSVGANVVLTTAYTDGRRIFQKLRITATTVAGLATCNAAAIDTWGAVTDALAPAYNATIAGGGAVHVPVYCDGALWKAR